MKVTIEFSVKNAIRITYSAFGKIQKVLNCVIAGVGMIRRKMICRLFIAPKNDR